MFLGHYGLAFALKRAEPKVSLGTLFAATMLADLLWGCFLLLGWEHVRIVPNPNPLLNLEFIDYPISHSLVGAIGWGIAAAVVYYSWPTRNTTRQWQASVLVGTAAASHFILDFLVHLPDLPLMGDDSLKVGLGLWNHFGLSLALELVLLAAGIAVYVAFRSRRHPVRPFRLVATVTLLVAVYIAAIFGPPPPSVIAIAIGDIVFLLLMVAIGAWADRGASP